MANPSTAKMGPKIILVNRKFIILPSIDLLMSSYHARSRPRMAWYHA